MPSAACAECFNALQTEQQLVASYSSKTEQHEEITSLVGRSFVVARAAKTCWPQTSKTLKMCADRIAYQVDGRHVAATAVLLRNERTKSGAPPPSRNRSTPPANTPLVAAIISLSETSAAPLIYEPICGRAFSNRKRRKSASGRVTPSCVHFNTERRAVERSLSIVGISCCFDVRLCAFGVLIKYVATCPKF